MKYVCVCAGDFIYSVFKTMIITIILIGDLNMMDAANVVI